VTTASGGSAAAEGLTIRGYARHRGVSHTAVRKALAAGRIAMGEDGKIDPGKADEQWTTSTNLSKPRNSVTGIPKKQRAPGAPSDPLGSPGLDEHFMPPVGEPGAARLAASYAASRAAREAYLARLAKLEFEQRSARLVEADEVRAQIFALGRRMRDAMMGLPDRLAPVLAGQTDQTEIHRLLAQEIMSSLAELSGAPPLTMPATQQKAS